MAYRNKKLRIEDATRAVLRGQTFVAKRDPPSFHPRTQPTLARLRCQERDPADYDDPAYRRYQPEERFG